MLSVEQAQSQVADLIAAAKRAGADAGDAMYVCNAATQVQIAAATNGMCVVLMRVSS